MAVRIRHVHVRMRQLPHRTLSPYEQTQLARYGIDFTDSAEFFDRYGEMPVEYITSHVEFCGLDFRVTPDTLIPRIETEELVALAVQSLQEQAIGRDAPVRFADVGTGSGAIAISVATQLASTGVDYELHASDVSPSALSVAKLNAQRLLTPQQCSRCQFLVSDLLQSYPANATFNCIIANLPYIPNARLSALDVSVKDYEPRLALDGGEDGLRLIRQLLAQAPTFLAPDGVMLLEVDDTHSMESWREYAQQWRVEIMEDQFGRTRFARAWLSTNTSGQQ